MKAIEVRDQVRLGAGKCFTLALSGMSYRLFRSAITVAILALAVAFLVHTVCYELMSQATKSSAYRELSKDRELGQQLTRLSRPDTRRLVFDALAQGDPRILTEYQRFGHLSAEALGQAQEAARLARRASVELSELPTAARAVLLGDRLPEQVLESLSTPTELSNFEAQVATLGIPHPSSDASIFTRLVQTALPTLIQTSVDIIRGHERALAALQQRFPGKSALELLGEPPPELLRSLHEAGFELNERDLTSLQTFARRSSDLKALNRLSQHSAVRAALAREARVDVAAVSLGTLAQEVTSPERAQWLHATLETALRSSGAGAQQAPEVPNAERIFVALSRYEHDQKLTRVAEAPSDQAVYWGLAPRTLWLIILSFLVCAVGVANAMLMSVTERFTEIATMKCLGAMDWFVMMMFVFEAAIQGALGGVIGILFGTLLAAVRGVVEYGSLFSSALGVVGETLLAASVSFGVAILLAAVAAVGPAFVAARLPPMEAMRVD